MRCTTLVLAVTALSGGIASAQPGPPPQPPPPPVDTTTTTTTTTEQTAAPLAPPPPVQTQYTAPVAQTTESEPKSARPDGMAIGLGIGYQLPTSLETPNITSMRLRLPSGFTIEPAFAIANTSTTNEQAGIEVNDKHTLFSLFALGRLPMISRGHADFEGLARVGFSNDKDNPDGQFNNTTTNRFAVGWGLAVGYWFSQHWQLSMNVTNDLIAYSSANMQTGAGMSTKTSTTEIGLIFVPQVFMMLHLYN